MAMRLRFRKPRKYVALAVAGLIAGGLLLAPAGAHVGNKLSHLFGHADKRYVRLVRSDVGGSLDLINSTPTNLSTVTIKAATSGVLVVQGSLVANNNSAGSDDDHVRVALSLDGGTAQDRASTSLGPEVIGGTFDREEVQTLSYVQVLEVAKGTHTVEQIVTAGGTGIDVDIRSGTLAVTFVPDGKAV